MKDVTRGITQKDSRAVVRQAIAAGCTVTITNGGHLRIETPDGQTYFASVTSGDRGSHRILRRALIKRGVHLSEGEQQ